MNNEEMIKAFLEIFPEKRDAYCEHLHDYGEFLQHPFCFENIYLPLRELLEKSDDAKTIMKYCGFIERMVSDGDDEVRNIADVTLLECLSDERTIWHRFGKYITNDLIRYINTRLIRENCAMYGVDKLEYNRRKHG